MREMWEEARCCLEWVNNNYDNNDDDVRIALLLPLMLFLQEQGIQATESPGELFRRENKV